MLLLLRRSVIAVARLLRLLGRSVIDVPRLCGVEIRAVDPGRGGVRNWAGRRRRSGREGTRRAVLERALRRVRSRLVRRLRKRSREFHRNSPVYSLRLTGGSFVTGAASEKGSISAGVRFDMGERNEERRINFGSLPRRIPHTKPRRDSLDHHPSILAAVQRQIRRLHLFPCSLLSHSRLHSSSMTPEHSPRHCVDGYCE